VLSGDDRHAYSIARAAAPRPGSTSAGQEGRPVRRPPHGPLLISTRHHTAVLLFRIPYIMSDSPADFVAEYRRWFGGNPESVSPATPVCCRLYPTCVESGTSRPSDDICHRPRISRPRPWPGPPRRRSNVSPQAIACASAKSRCASRLASPCTVLQAPDPSYCPRHLVVLGRGF